MSSAFSPPPSAFKHNILKKTLFPDYRALYRRTRKYKFWPRHRKSYFLSLPLTVTCLHLLKDIMEFVLLRPVSDADFCKKYNITLDHKAFNRNKFNVRVRKVTLLVDFH